MAEKKSKLTLVKLDKSNLAQGKHVLIVESPESRRAVSLNVNVFSIGRHPHNDLVVGDLLASRHHATLAWMKYSEGVDKVDYSYWIIDGKGKRKRSRNGIYINGQKKLLHRLVSGDIIKIGDNMKITYSYITYNTNTSQFLNYSNKEKSALKTNNSRQKHYKSTVMIENSFPANSFVEDTNIIKNSIADNNLLEDNNNLEETMVKQDID